MSSNIYIVKPEDLIGQINGFPIEVVQMMVERQYEQCSICNIEVFQRNVTASSIGNGFTWGRTREGQMFWDNVISNRNFNEFFDMYPHYKEFAIYIVNGNESNLRDAVCSAFGLKTGLHRFAFKAKKEDVYYIDYEKFQDYKVRFALAGTSIAEEAITKSEKGVTTNNPINVDEDAKCMSGSMEEITFQLLKDALSMPLF